MRNAVGREIPDEILKATGKEPFQGNNYKNGVPFRRVAPIIRPVMDNQHSKLVANIREALIKCKAHSGMTVASVFRGAIPCGTPETVEAAIDQFVRLPTALFGDGNLYVIWAKGDSMIEAGIDDGDMIIVDADKEPATGDKVVALDQDNESTLKTLRYDEKSARYYLHPENRLLDDIYVDELTVQGVVRFIIKKG